jgi:hypothetical protein
MKPRSIFKSSLLVTMFLLAACTSAPAQKKASPASVAVLLKLDGVRQELGITPVQAGLLDALHTQYKSQAKNIMAFGQDGDDGALRSEWDIRSLRKQYNARALAVLTSDQQNRLLEIQRQMLGGNLLSSPSEQSLLGLSADQQAQIAALSNSGQAQARAVTAQAAAGQISDYSKRSQLRRIQNQQSSQMLAVLTPDQKKQWKILSGQKSGLPDIHDPNARTMSLFEGY